jgi:putative transposase
LEMAIRTRGKDNAELSGLVHHSDRGVRSWRSATPNGSPPRRRDVGCKQERLVRQRRRRIPGRPVRTELIRRHGPWKGLDDVELATLEWVDWYNHRRPHTYCDNRPPAELEQPHYSQTASSDTTKPVEHSLH